MDFAEKYAVQRGKIFFRLDSAETNEVLARYYKSNGFYEIPRYNNSPGEDTIYMQLDLK